MVDRRTAGLGAVIPDPLLGDDEPPAFLSTRPGGTSSFVIAVDHAGARIPRALGTLGVPESELSRHIAWDIGALGIAQGIAARLNATLVAQNYSRLVIDCNRDPRVATSIVTMSEWTPIPGNVGLTPAQAAQRRAAIFDPYHAHLSALLDDRIAAGRRTILVSQHTMTDVYKGSQRPMHAAVLYNRDRRYAGLVLEALRAIPGLVIADNEPYYVTDETDYTIPHHGEARGLPHVEIEVRQDLVSDAAGQAEWAGRLATVLKSAERLLFGGP